MLYGKENVWKEILADGQKVAWERNVKLVYAATLGSLSRGIPSADSDYDVRFLYINSDFPDKKYDPTKCEERDIVFRMNVKQNRGGWN